MPSMPQISPGSAFVGDGSKEFRALYDANRQRIGRVLAEIVGPRDAEDLAQIVFAKAAAALPRFHGGARASTWLYRIATNVAVDWLRSRVAHEARATVRLADPPDTAAALGSPALDVPKSPERALLHKEMCDCIRAVIAQLPVGPRTVLMLGELGGLAQSELAQALGVSRGNAKVRLHRARARLKTALEGRCDFYRDEDNEFACEPKAAGPCTASRGRAAPESSGL